MAVQKNTVFTNDAGEVMIGTTGTLREGDDTATFDDFDGPGLYKIAAKAGVDSFASGTIFDGLSVGEYFESAAGTDVMKTGDKAKALSYGTPLVGDGTSDFDDLTGGGLASGAGTYKITAKGTPSLFTGEVGDLVEIDGDEVMLADDTAALASPGVEYVGDGVKTFAVHTGGSGIGYYQVTAKGSPVPVDGTLFDGLYVGDIFEADGTEVMLTGDSARFITPTGKILDIWSKSTVN